MLTRLLATQLLDEVERAAVLVGRGFVPDLVAYAEERWTEAEYSGPAAPPARHALC